MMKLKKIKFIVLLFSTLIVFFGLDLSLNAKAVNVFPEVSISDSSESVNFTFSPSVFYLMSIGVIGLAVISRRGISPDSLSIDRNYLTDHGGRRSKVDRRRFSYDLIIPERRSGRERRVNADRRLT